MNATDFRINTVGSEDASEVPYEPVIARCEQKATKSHYRKYAKPFVFQCDA